MIGKVNNTVQKYPERRIAKNTLFLIQNKNHCLHMDDYFTNVPLLNYSKTKTI